MLDICPSEQHDLALERRHGVQCSRARPRDLPLPPGAAIPNPCVAEGPPAIVIAPEQDDPVSSGIPGAFASAVRPTARRARPRFARKSRLARRAEPLAAVALSAHFAGAARRASPLAANVGCTASTALERVGTPAAVDDVVTRVEDLPALTVALRGVIRGAAALPSMTIRVTGRGVWRIPLPPAIARARQIVESQMEAHPTPERAADRNTSHAASNVRRSARWPPAGRLMEEPLRRFLR